MNNYTDLGYVVTASGDVDVNYYINKAQRLRNQAIKAKAVAVVDGIKKLVKTIKLPNSSETLSNAKPA